MSPDPLSLNQIGDHKLARERAWRQHKAETRQRVSIEQREYEAGFDAGWWKRGLDNAGDALELVLDLLERMRPNFWCLCYGPVPEGQPNNHRADCPACEADTILRACGRLPDGPVAT
jgi:hypothetical protein